MNNSNSDEVDLYVDKKLEMFENEYLKTRTPIPVSFRNLCLNWKWAKRSDVYTHAIHKYPARLLPYIPIFFLSTTRYANEDDIILDPFAGSGTVLLESMVHPYFKRNAYGVEINPLARLISKVKVTPLDDKLLRKNIDALFKSIDSYSKDPIISKFKNIDMWFSPNVQRDLAIIKACIEKIKDGNYKDFFLMCFSSINRNVSLADRSIPPPVLIKPEKFKDNPEMYSKIKLLFNQKYNATPITEFKKTVEKNAIRVKNLSEITKVSSNKVCSKIIWDDSMNLKYGIMKPNGVIDDKNAVMLEKNSIGMVITSPPYMSAQKYMRSTRLESLWLGLLNESEIASIDKKTIGSERISVKFEDVSPIDIKDIDTLALNVYMKHPERGKIFAKFFHDMKIVFRQLNYVLKPKGKIILIVGANKVLGQEIDTPKLLSRVAEEESFKTIGCLVDEIRSRGIMTKRHETGGLIKNEYILILEKN